MSASFTPTASETSTASPVLTATKTPGGEIQVYPNPFHPDRGEVFHLGNVPPGLRANIYNIIGEYVFGITTKGDPSLDRWDGMNANKVKVVTGMYFLQINGKIYRLAVLRD